MKKHSMQKPQRNSDLFVGLDVHKATVDVALADEGRDSEVRHYGKITGDLDALDKVMRKLQSPGRTLRVVYEAGPCGYAIYRHLSAIQIGSSQTWLEASLHPLRYDKEDGGTGCQRQQKLRDGKDEHKFY